LANVRDALAALPDAYRRLGKPVPAALEQADAKRFLVLEQVEGETLAERIRKGALPVDEALAICRRIGRIIAIKKVKDRQKA
jgi:tRNA A-37 threonylcarbamoyl transferase component Bud32